MDIADCSCDGGAAGPAWVPVPFMNPITLYSLRSRAFVISPNRIPTRQKRYFPA